MKRLLHKIANALLWFAGRWIPVRKNRITVTNFQGRGWGDNPKAIVEELLRRDGDWEILWLVDDDAAAQSLPRGIRAVRNTPWNRIHALCSAKIWIDNNRKGARVKKRGQWYLQTWHGFALKQIERDALDSLPPDYAAFAMRDSAQTDLMVSGSGFMSRIYRDAFWYDGEIALYGSPRNDCFFRPHDGARRAVCEALGIPENRKLVLYAPTFRADGNLDVYDIDCARLCRALAERFGGDWAALLRLHPNLQEKADLLPCDGETIFDATAYHDMQQLLCAADAVVSDYSSLMFDYALTGRPCFQFAVDIAAYEKERDFYFPLREMPFPLAQSNDDLERCILAWDSEKAAREWTRFRDKFEIFEDGHASERCADRIVEILSGA